MTTSPLKEPSQPLSNNPGRSTKQRDYVTFGSPVGAQSGPPVYVATNTVTIKAVGTYVHGTMPAQGAAKEQGIPYALVAADLTTRGIFMVMGLDSHDLARLRFACSHATDPNGKTAKARIWKGSGARAPSLLNNTVPFYELMGDYCGELSLVCGNLALATGSAFVDTTVARPVSKWVDTITIPTTELTRTPGMQVTGSAAAAANDTVASVTFDMEGDRYLIVQIVDDTNDGTVGWMPLLKLI